MNKIIQQSIIKSYDSKENIFDIVLNNIIEWYEKPAHTFKELKDKESKKIKGDYFEELCTLYLKNSDKFTYKNVWLLYDIPEEIRNILGLRKKDFGIDIVCETLNNKFIAVQCKYRKNNTYKKNIITWKMLSTFYALCLRTGPWEKYIVMTNAEYVTHMGIKTNKDISICVGTFRKIPVEVWQKMAQEPLQEPLEEVLEETVETLEELRRKRLEMFG